ncbi:hypothetical protein So717_29690 [Roseobacter cerasinus]|uniref:Uncharacterized protein n=1 Tax=Roseobacter cerasinus TaxID=2602289 RepID=A0A640VYB1_9RHOB|nr:hypothetical protein [Roseobacter cerasinus]GFE51216.1 hypothetical protein So717_29690 [Roseobacter cerasinus]
MLIRTDQEKRSIAFTLSPTQHMSPTRMLAGVVLAGTENALSL